ncbi:MAG: methylmalonyl Co-A mutase-associated GTPase MeaB [Bacteroidota bacterium]
MSDYSDLILGLKQGDFIAIARSLTIVENDISGSVNLLRTIEINQDVPVIGVTGPPGAGKSTLVNAMIDQLCLEGKKVAVIAVDPTSPFNLGSLLGDRIRMATQFNKPNVFIRSVATRGSVGGLSAKIIEMTDVLKSANFDYIIVETVGVGQSEIEIAGLADLTIVLLVPEAGDEIQHIKSGLMEIGDIFVVNKSDRDGADAFAANLKKFFHQSSRSTPVLKTIADKNIGVNELLSLLKSAAPGNDRRLFLYAEKAYKLIQNHKMKDLKKEEIHEKLKQVVKNEGFNLHRFVELYLN